MVEIKTYQFRIFVCNRAFSIEKQSAKTAIRRVLAEGDIPLLENALSMECPHNHQF